MGSIPTTDRQYIEEFRKQPIGHHSPGLVRLSTVMRQDPSGRAGHSHLPQAVPRMGAGRDAAGRADPIAIESGPVFTSREEAEWEVFRRRWRSVTGEAINLPYPGHNRMLKIRGLSGPLSAWPRARRSRSRSRWKKARISTRGLVRVVHGDANPAGPGLEVPPHPDRDRRQAIAGKLQRIDAGSYMIVEKAPAIAAKPFTFFAMIWPTLPERPGPDACWRNGTRRPGAGFRIAVDEGRLSVDARRRQGTSRASTAARPCWCGNGTRSRSRSIRPRRA